MRRILSCYYGVIVVVLIILLMIGGGGVGGGNTAADFIVEAAAAPGGDSSGSNLYYTDNDQRHRRSRHGARQQQQQQQIFLQNQLEEDDEEEEDVATARLEYILAHSKDRRWKKGVRRKQQQRRKRRERSLEDAAAADDDDYYENNDDDDGGGNNNNNDDDDAEDYQFSEADEKCSQFLVRFLEGATDAHDTCEGLMNAYTSAGCAESNGNQYDNYYQNIDDYFEEFAGHECCSALLAHHTEYCEADRLLTNFHLFVTAAVLLLCEVAKAFVNRYHIHFLPEAAVCILVGTICGVLAHVLPFGGLNIDDISFDDELFLTVLLPPIIFEAALSVSKNEFRRRRGAIFMFSVFGTIFSTFSTGLMVHYSSKWMSFVTTFPALDSLVFGALISSIDPVAILSVLSSLNLDQKDTIFILVFGESLLNDGIAITVFQVLVDRFDGRTKDGTTSADEIFDALATFLIVMFGSIAVGLIGGVCAWVYFFYLDKSLPPVMEVGSFFLWALIPYYVADSVRLSGIVTIVVVGFFMDIYIAGPKRGQSKKDDDAFSSRGYSRRTSNNSPEDDALEMTPSDYRKMPDAPVKSMITVDSIEQRSVQPFLSSERLHLSAIADRHVRFVAHLTAQLSENAIFAYLGLFLFSGHYDWDPALITISIVSCVLSRSLMVIIISCVIYNIYRCRGRVGNSGDPASDATRCRTAAAISNPRTQAVLVLAGLRGAVSLALVENVPLINQGTGEGCEFKQVMKGMTSASILFTTFVFGGGAYYILPLLGVGPDRPSATSEDDLSGPPPVIGEALPAALPSQPGQTQPVVETLIETQLSTVSDASDERKVV